MKHRLTVKIEKRFKRQLSKRFNPRNARDYDFHLKKTISITCLLCDEYMENNDCEGCPFKQFEQKDESCREIKFTRVGCLVWIRRVVGKSWLDVFDMSNDMLLWDEQDNKEAVKLLKKLREKAKKYIIWVENKPIKVEDL